jgi:hypothetical protein
MEEVVDEEEYVEGETEGEREGEGEVLFFLGEKVHEAKDMID